MLDTERMSDPAAFPPLVVGTDRAAVRRPFLPVIAIGSIVVVLSVLGALLAGAGMASIDGNMGLGVLSGVSLLIPAAFLSLVVLQSVSIMSARAAIGRVLRLDAEGMQWTTPGGDLTVPWAAVSSVRVRRRMGREIAVFQLDPAVNPAAPGVRTDWSPKLLARATQTGLHIGSIGIDQPLSTVLAATSAFTAGRLVAR